MCEKKIKVAMVTNHFEITGIGTIMMNYCSELNKKKYDLTILAGKPIADKYRKECKKNEIHLIELPSRHGEPIKHYVALWKRLKAGNYDIVHDHGNSSMMAIELTIAKMVGVKNRIAHSHNSTCPNMKVHKILNPYFKRVYTKALACGQLAGDWLFGENEFEILPNGFQTENFKFSKENREMIRKGLGIKDQFVIGHIGRINEQKNHDYLLKVFEKIASRREDAILLIVGTGPDEKKVREQIENHRYQDRIILYGEANNPMAFYSAMDVFAFPSKFEGLPVVLLEAQISGLQCVVSDKITQEVDLGDVKWRSIEQNPIQWADAVLELKQRTEQERFECSKKCLESAQKYNIKHSVKQLDKIYIDLVE